STASTFSRNAILRDWQNSKPIQITFHTSITSCSMSNSNAPDSTIYLPSLLCQLLPVNSRSFSQLPLVYSSSFLLRFSHFFYLSSFQLNIES
ncbi:unnamed protein product, partial [Hymenolepis diminuta]